MSNSPTGISRKVRIVAIGSAGCHIVSDLSAREDDPDLQEALYVSCDERDLRGLQHGEKILVGRDFVGRASPYHLRGLALKQYDAIKEALAGTDIVFVVSGLGGSVGTAISPVVAWAIKDVGAKALGLFVMPFSFEKEKHFYAGSTLRRLRNLLDGTIVFDNDEIGENAPRDSLSEIFSQVNRKIGIVLASIIGPAKENTFDVSLDQFYSCITSGGGLAILSIFWSSSLDRAEESVNGAIKGIYQTADPRQATGAVLYLEGNKRVSVSDMDVASGRLRSLLGNGNLPVHTSLKVKDSHELTAVVVASGFKSTKYDRYDPVHEILKGSEIDDEFDLGIEVPMPKLTLLDPMAR